MEGPWSSRGRKTRLVTSWPRPRRARSACASAAIRVGSWCNVPSRHGGAAAGHAPGRCRSAGWASELQGQGRSVFRRGHSSLERITLAGAEWLVDHQHCPNQECDCERARVALVRVSEGAPARFDVMVDLEEEAYGAAKNLQGLTQEETEHVLDAYDAAKPELFRQLAVERTSVQAVALQSAIRHSRTGRRGRVARNSPCPCGSGARFKGCCGRRAPSEAARP